MGERLGAPVHCLEEVLTVLFKNRPSFAFWRVFFFRRLISGFFKKKTRTREIMAGSGDVAPPQRNDGDLRRVSDAGILRTSALY